MHLWLCLAHPSGRVCVNSVVRRIGGHLTREGGGARAAAKEGERESSKLKAAAAEKRAKRERGRRTRADADGQIDKCQARIPSHTYSSQSVAEDTEASPIREMD